MDDSSIVFVADPTFGDILNFNVGQAVDLDVPRVSSRQCGCNVVGLGLHTMDLVHLVSLFVELLGRVGKTDSLSSDVHPQRVIVCMLPAMAALLYRTTDACVPSCK